jgi:hypothetical protein
MWGKKKKSRDEVYDEELDKTVNSLKDIADNLQETADEFKTQIEALKLLNQAKAAQETAK